MAYGIGQILRFNKTYIAQCSEIKEGIESQNHEEQENLKSFFLKNTKQPQYLHFVINSNF